MKHSTLQGHIEARNAKAVGLLDRAGYATGGVVKKLKKGGHVGGKMPKASAHKKSRGGHHVNIIIGANQGEKQQAARQGLAMGAKLGAAMMAKKMAGAGAMAPPPGAMPPGPPPPGMMPAPPGGPGGPGGPPPPGLALGGPAPIQVDPGRPGPIAGRFAPPTIQPPPNYGRFAYKKGGAVSVKAYARGGALAKVPKMKGGAGGGQGRIAKSVDVPDAAGKVKAHLRKYPHKRGGKV